MIDVRKIKDELAASKLTKRVIIIEGPIKDANIDFIHTSLLALDDESNKEIKLYFRTGGGYAEAGLMLYELLQTLRSPTTGIVNSANSIAGVILQGCKKRLILKSGRILIHSPAPMLEVMQNLRYNDSYDEQIEIISQSLKEAKEATERIFLKRTKMDAETLKEVFRKGDLYEMPLTAEEAKEYGVVDDIINGDFNL